MNAAQLRYLLITPAKNEAAFIELTIQSVISQTVRPVQWIIVNDGSTDRTAEIVEHMAKEHSWIRLLQMPERRHRDFASKADCVNTAHASTRDLQYDVIASLDGDISFDKEYFEFLLQKFAADARLGIAGTPFSENGNTYNYRFSSTHHVSGACQLFRRECFEALGGYTPVKGGGIDVIAVLGARMKGWRTQTFTQKTCCHHRLMGSAQEQRKARAIFSAGQKDYRLGFHPLWEMFRSAYQMTRKPYFISGALLLTGYSWAMVRRSKRSVTPELLKFQREDQMRRLRRFFGLEQNQVTPESTPFEFDASTARVSKS